MIPEKHDNLIWLLVYIQILFQNVLKTIIFSFTATGTRVHPSPQWVQLFSNVQNLYAN
jgi:hypothetical protein